MSLALSTFRKELPKDLLRIAGRLAVRECDETGKGEFEGYVDDGHESFDVRIGFDGAATITGHQCDCGTGSLFCRHRAALLLHIESGAKVKVGTAALRRKKTPAEELLGEVGGEELKTWLLDQLHQNKDLQLAFISRFGRRREVTVEEVREQTLEAVRAVVARKQAIDFTQLKRILSLWEGLHQPAVEHYRAHVSDPAAFHLFQTLLQTAASFQPWLTTQSTKLQDYLDKLVQGSIAPVNDLATEGSWDRAVACYADSLSPAEELSALHLRFLRSLAEVSSEDRRSRLAALVMKRFCARLPTRHLPWVEAVLQLVRSTGCLADHVAAFPAFEWQPEYNTALLQELMSAGEWDRAEEICREQIAGNTSSRFDLPYLEVLKEVYLLRHDNDQLLPVLEQLLRHTWSLEDYHLLCERLEPEDAKRFRTRLLLQARNGHGEVRAAHFLFALLAEGGEWVKMISCIDGTTPVSALLPYLDELYRADRLAFLNALLSREDRFGFIFPDNEEEWAAKEDLAGWAIRRYHHQDLRKAVREQEARRRGFRGNTLLKMMSGLLEGSDF